VVGSGARMNKSAPAPLPHRLYPSWRRLGVDGIVCLPIPRIGSFKSLGWCHRGGGGDPIMCVHPPALSSLLRRWLQRHCGARRMCCLGVYGRWKMVYHMLGLWMEVDSSDFLPDAVVVQSCFGVRSRVQRHVASV
jgi:hypothetical protein